MQLLSVPLYQSESESDVSSNLLHCFLSVFILQWQQWRQTSKQRSKKNRFRFRSNINELFFVRFHIEYSWYLITNIWVSLQWRIQDFPEEGAKLRGISWGGSSNSQKCYYFNFLPKTKWKWQDLDPHGVRVPGAPWIRQCFRYLDHKDGDMLQVRNG